MIGVFIDGPLVGEVKNIPRAPEWRVRIPPRTTWCDCDPGLDSIPVEQDAEVVTYKVIAHGEKVAILAVEGDDSRILDVLKSWTQSNLGAERWNRHCRDARAFA